MKVNLRKIGAIVAGATILASTAAFGALWFENTQLVNENGAPVAKVVVGENAAASDGVAAALIAGKLVNSAYKTATLSGQLVGTPTCTATGEGGGACTISDEKAQLEIKVPGAVAEGTYTFNTLIGDYINRRLLDRIDNTAGGSDVEYPYSASETSDNANPFTDNAGGNLGDAPDEEILYKITGEMFSPLATTTIKDDEAAKTYSETQNIWLKGETDVYKEEDGVQGKFELVAYTLKFGGTGNEYGIPVCTTPTNGDYSYCKSNKGDISYATETHKVNVWFLGEKWIISEMEPSSTSLPNDQNLVDGGYIKLAKESVSGILNQGESLPVDGYKFHLDDLEAHGDLGVSAIISVLDANDNIIKKDKVGPGQTKEFNIEGKTYRFHVYKVAPGYTYGAKWADVAIYSKELKLASGEELDEDQGKNPNWKVALGWKNKNGAPDNVGTDGNEAAPDHLRTVILYSDALDELTVGGDEEKMNTGSYIPFVEDPVAWKLTYRGLDLTTTDRDTLKFDLVKTGDKSISDAIEDSNNPGQYFDCKVVAPYIKVTSSKKGSVFRVENAYRAYDDGADTVSTLTDLTDNEFYLSMTGVMCGTGDLEGGILMKLSPSSDHYGFAPFDDDTLLNNQYEKTLWVEYEDIGDGDSVFFNGGGVIGIKPINTATTTIPDEISDGIAGGSVGAGTFEEYLDPDVDIDSLINTNFLFVVAEKAGEGTSDDSTDYWVFGVDNTPTFKYEDAVATTKIMSDNGDEIFYTYAGPVHGIGTFGMKEDGFISERGSVFDTLKEDRVQFKMANKLGHAVFQLTSTGATGGEESTCVATLAEGQDYTCAGVTVKVLEITEKGVCGAGAGACTGSTEGMSAKVVDQTGAEVTTAYIPYADAYRGLVILDRDAVGVGTLISVGGDRVNTITAGLLSGSPVDWSAPENRVVVREVVQGQKIVVAGKEADDTIEAANQFISRLRSA